MCQRRLRTCYEKLSKIFGLIIRSNQMKISKNIIFMLALAFSFSYSSAREISLEDAIIIGLDNNYQVKIAASTTKLARINNAWGAAGRYPTIDASVTQGNRFDNGTTQPGMPDERTTTSLSASLGLNWVLFDGFSIADRKDKLEVVDKMTQNQEYDVRESLVKDITLAYYQAQLDKEKMKVLDKVMALSSDRYRRVELSKELGNAVTFDVLQLKNNYLRDSTNVLLQEINYRNSLRNLNLLLGESNDTEYEPVGDMQPEKMNSSYAELRSEMLEKNKSLKTLRYNQSILKSELNINENAWLPSISLNSGFDYNNARVKYQGMDANSSDNYDYFANLRLSVNIFNGGNTERALEAAKIDVEQSEYQISETQIRLENTLKSLVELYELRSNLYNVSVENLKSAELNLQIAEQKFDSGAISSFNFRDIQMIYLNAAFDKIQATYDLVDSEQAIKKLTGQIVYRR